MMISLLVNIGRPDKKMVMMIPEMQMCYNVDITVDNVDHCVGVQN